ncbi:MAG: penicillin-binding protein 2 [Brevibacillus sp.]|nr:penicillin-binding protein 2 [Brevibacillus sp.]
MSLSRKTKQRAFLLLLLFSLVWGILIFRLSWIQLVAVHHFSRQGVDLVKQAVRQREQTVTLDSGRGDILDRNGNSFTGKEQLALIVFPLARGRLQDQETIRQIASIIGRRMAELEHLLSHGKEPAMLRDEKGKPVALTEQQAEQINRLKIPGFVAVNVTERYRSDAVAQSVIGYVNQNPAYIQSEYEEEWRSGKMSLDSTVGAAGLERTFDRFLQGVAPSRLSYVVDGQGRPLGGLGIRYHEQENSFYPLSLVTTLDRQMQDEMEWIADQAGLTEGSIVVLDAATADVLSMVSRPAYDQTNVDVKAGAWQNRAVKQLPPGSVFKTVVAAAALAEEAVSPTERFVCEGEYGHYGFSCWKRGGHGSITLEEAYAHSCNIAFAQIAKRLGGDTIQSYAERLGLLAPVGWSAPHLYKMENFRQIDGEEPGRVFMSEVYHDEGTLIQTAIGQRDVRITPLSAANLMVTMLNGGQPRQVRLVREITYRNGGTFHLFPLQPLPVEGIDPVTSYKLTRLMRLVVAEGTGKPLVNLSWPVAGKSGTAQAETGQGMRYHHWFVGYAPADHPRYAIAVVAENQPVTASHQGIKIFGKVVEALASLSKQSAGLPSAPDRE